MASIVLRWCASKSPAVSAAACTTTSAPAKASGETPRLRSATNHSCTCGSSWFAPRPMPRTRSSARAISPPRNPRAPVTATSGADLARRVAAAEPAAPWRRGAWPRRCRGQCLEDLRHAKQMPRRDRRRTAGFDRLVERADQLGESRIADAGCDAARDAARRPGGELNPFDDRVEHFFERLGAGIGGADDDRAHQIAGERAPVPMSVSDEAIGRPRS